MYKHYTVRTQYNDTVGFKNICQHIEFSSILNFIIHHLFTYLFTVACTICIYDNKMFYVDFIINMTYNTHNRTTLLKQPKSDKKNKYI